MSEMKDVLKKPEETRGDSSKKKETSLASVKLDFSLMT